MSPPPIVLQPEHLSALCDGEADAPAVAALCGAWRDDEALRGRWHDYQLIGDVLRSDDLARPAADDAAFLRAVRARLAAEPVVLAPAGGDDAVVRPAAVPARRRWLGSGAIAAGFVVVAAAAFVLRPAVEPSAQLAVAPVPTPAPPTVAALDAEQPAAASGVLVRDAGLDRYLAAHQQFGGDSVLAVPSGFLRNATYEGPSR
jgi:sigma-E factor negative regulatory protein RseA